MGRAVQLFVILGIFLVISLAFYAQERKLKPPVPTQQSIQVETNNLETVVSGISKAHGIAFTKDTIYVSSDTEGLVSFKDGQVRQLAPLVTGRTIFVETDGSLVVPVFSEDKVVKVGKDDVLTDFPIVLSGPTGITKDNRGNFYVTNHTSGSVTTFRQDGKNARVLIDNLEKPTGIFYNNQDNTLYIADSGISGITTYRLDTKERVDILFVGLENMESISVVSSRILVTATANGKSVIAELDEKKGSFKVILEISLPQPVIAHFTKDNEVYLVSPEDPEGKVITIKLNL